MQPTTFVNRLSNVVGSLDRDVVKSAIGDSTDNNRTLTVGQVVRYLTTRRKRSLKQLGGHLARASAELGYRVRNDRASRGSNRTDAIDINEFLGSAADVVNYYQGGYSYGILQDSLKRA